LATFSSSDMCTPWVRLLDLRDLPDSVTPQPLARPDA